jgi:RimJ/RimL family protein N-acetyltransferase
MSAEVLRTERLSLWAAREEDFEALYTNVLSDPEVMRLVLAGGAMDRAAARALFETLDHAGDGREAGVLKELATGEVIGFAGCSPTQVLGEADYEIGFVLARSAQGKGYASEIGRAQLRFGFDVLGCARLLGQAAPGNAASIATLEKIGMRRHSTRMSEGRGERVVFVAQADD